jgi:hypothetical protein
MFCQAVGSENQGERGCEECEMKSALRPSGNSADRRSVVTSERGIHGNVRHPIRAFVPDDIEAVRVEGVLDNLARRENKQRVIDVKGTA